MTPAPGHDGRLTLLDAGHDDNDQPNTKSEPTRERSSFAGYQSPQHPTLGQFARMTTAVILQSNYIPWRGYFDLIRRADHFVFYDEVQYTKRDWRNRNRIVGPNGAQWLTIPVATGGKYDQTIAETQVTDPNWARDHMMSVQRMLARGSRYTAFAPKLRDWYDAAAHETSLSAINQLLIRNVMAELGLTTTLHQSNALGGPAGQTARLVEICRALDVQRYLSGPAASSYLDEALFADAGIAVDWMDYPEYPSYTQSNGSYDPKVSIIDCLAWLSPADIFGASVT